MSTVLAMKSPVETKFSKQTGYWLEIANSTEIFDYPGYEMAAAHLQAIKELKAEADKTFDPIVAAAFATHKEAVAQKKRICEPLNQAETVLKAAMATYAQEQERIRRDEERRLREEAERQAAEEREREIEHAEANGATSEEIAVMVEAPLQRKPVVVAPVQRVSGITMRETWKAEITDLAALVKYVSTRPELSNLLAPNLPAINALARSLRSALNIPGVRVYNEASIAATTNRRTS